MKRLSKWTAALLLVAAPLAQAQLAPDEKEVQIGISGAFVPGGFDSNSDSYVVINGVFPNGCYRWSRSEQKDVDAFHHDIKSIAIVKQGMCLMVLMPFQKDIRLGKLPAGTHALRFLNGDGTYLEKTLVIQ
ncbi:MAG: hypothetical protein KF681_07550 [Bdellovibrionaceae bacterium]|nr:hypothetical protein [Pseudobdellovibrionaceae bacterium]